MARQGFKLTKEHTPQINTIIRAFIQTDSKKPIIGSLTENSRGGSNNVLSIYFANRRVGDNDGILVTAFLENPITDDNEIDVTVDQEDANFAHSPIPSPLT